MGGWAETAGEEHKGSSHLTVGLDLLSKRDKYFTLLPQITEPNLLGVGILHGQTRKEKPVRYSCHILIWSS